MSFDIYLQKFVNEATAKLHEKLQNQTIIIPEYLTPYQASVLTGFSLRALESMRSKGKGPEYVKFGSAKNGPIRYRIEDIRAWMQKHKEDGHGAY